MLASLRTRLANVPQVGRLEWIGVRPGHEAPMIVLDAARALPDRGLEGDRASARAGGKRQVTLLQAEHLEVVAKLVGRAAVPPELLRRNLVIAGINLRSLEKLRFRVGEVVLEGSGPCEPCAKLDAALGAGGFQAVRGHGGITARVIRGGVLRVGDRVHAGERPANERPGG